MKIYACLGLALAVIAAIVYNAMGSKKDIKVSLDDIASPEDDEPKPKRKRAGVKRAQGAPEPKAKKEKDDWEDDPFEKDTLYKLVDDNGPYPKSMTGTVEPNEFRMLRRVI